MWHAHHLSLHGLRQVLELRHGNSMIQSYEVGMNALERSLRIRTCDVIPSSLSIYDVGSSLVAVVPHMHMNGRCHYVLSRKNMSF